MVCEDRRTTPVTASDVRSQYLAADALFRAVGSQDPMPFWKSAPYLAHFMHGYKFHELLVPGARRGRVRRTRSSMRSSATTRRF